MPDRPSQQPPEGAPNETDRPAQEGYDVPLPPDASTFGLGAPARKLEPPAPEPEPPPPPTPAETLERVLATLRRRAWKVYGGTALLALVAGAGLLFLGAAALLGTGGPVWIRPLALGAAALGAIGAGWWAWSRAGRPSDVELARRLEDRDPAARGLTTAVELAAVLRRAAEGAPFSAELARAHVRRAAEQVADAGVERAFDLRPLRRAGGAAALSLTAVALGALLAAPVGPGLSRLARGEARRDPGEAPPVAPITGDISLTYLYPAHTGLSPKTIEGTGGEIEAPVGTQVRIETRADRDLAKAFIDVDGASLPMEVKGRQLQGTLLVQRSGSYRFRFVDGRDQSLAVGPQIPITAAVDGAPTVEILAPIAELTVTETDAVELRFEAADDYGVAKVELVYQVGNTAEQTVPMATFGSPRRRADGSFQWELALLGLRPGDVVHYHLRATDNDAVSGAKQGQSRVQTLHVFSEAEHRRALVARVEEAWEAMVLALGDRITPRAGPQAVRGPARIEAGAPADEQVLQVGSALADVAAELRKDERAPEELTAAVGNISRNLLEKNRLTRQARARARLAPDGALALLDRAEGSEQRELESGVLYLEALLDRQRILQIEELAREMATSRRELTALLEEYREAPSDAAREEILRELSRMRDRMNELMRRMAELSKGIQDEHLNAEAMQAIARERNLMGGLDEIEKLLGEGKIDEALAKLQELGMQMDEMAHALSEAADTQAENDPALRELAAEMQRFEDQLQSLQQDQAELAQATEQLKREQARELERQLEKNGQALVDELKRKVEQAQQRLSSFEAEVPQRISDDLAGARERLENLEDALSVRDFDSALESAAQAMGHLQNLEVALQLEISYAERFDLPDRPALEKAQAQSREASRLVREVKEKLEEVFADPARRMTAEQRQQMDRMARRQGELEQRMNDLRQQAERIGQQAPIFDESARQAMQNAQQAMGEAGERLQGRNPGGALAAERRAQEQLQSLQQGLERARQQSGRGRGGGFPLPFASGGGRGRSGGDGSFDTREKVAIPGADQYKAPDEFRKDILDAMKQDAPAPFKEHVREYDEEIVK